MPAPDDPTADEVFGRSVSPTSSRTASIGRPSASAATCVITVVVPVPNSWALVATVALPSKYTRARACWVGMKNATGYAAAAIPVPISH